MTDAMEVFGTYRIHAIAKSRNAQVAGRVDHGNLRFHTGTVCDSRIAVALDQYSKESSLE